MKWESEEQKRFTLRIPIRVYANLITHLKKNSLQPSINESIVFILKDYLEKCEEGSPVVEFRRDV